MPTLTIFFILAAVTVISALGVIFNKNVVHSALFLLVNFGTLAIFYFMLNAQFLGVAQILVYAGAIVVLFLFVVMLIGADLGEPVTSWLTGRNVMMIVLGLVLLTVLGTAVFENTVFGASSDTLTQADVAEFGQTQMIGSVLFTEYTLPFQLVAVLLSVGVLGVVWLAQHQQRQKFRQVVVVLDAGWDGESQREHYDKLRINWLRRPTMFDFDWIEIKQATDDDVERLLAQIEADTDRWRMSRYPQMQVLIDPACNLSTALVTRMREMFGEVKETKIQEVQKVEA